MVRDSAFTSKEAALEAGRPAGVARSAFEDARSTRQLGGMAITAGRGW
jgi:hypothetical protein